MCCIGNFVVHDGVHKDSDAVLGQDLGKDSMDETGLVGFDSCFLLALSVQYWSLHSQPVYCSTVLCQEMARGKLNNAMLAKIARYFYLCTGLLINLLLWQSCISSPGSKALSHFTVDKQS